jgi:hypothetical protein
MGKHFSKPFFSFSTQLNFILSTDRYYLNANHNKKRLIRQGVMRHLGSGGSSPKKLPEFVPPVLRFVPRSVLLSSKTEAKSKIDKVNAQAPDSVIQNMVRRERPSVFKKKTRPNKKIRARLRLRKQREAEERRLERAELPIPTSQMTRRVRILSVAARVEFVQSLALSVVSLVETLKSFIYWGYYAMTADDFGTLSRLTSFFNERNRGNADDCARVFERLRLKLSYLFMMFIYVTRFNEDFRLRLNYSDLEDLFSRLLRQEGIDNLAILLEDGYTFNLLRDDVLEDEPIWRIFAQREHRHISAILNKHVSKELTRLRGMRFFRNVTSTLLSIPLVRLSSGVSTIPRNLVEIGNTLATLTMTPGTESTAAFMSNDYHQFVSEASQLISLPDVINSAERALFRRGRREVAPTEEPRFVELDDDEEEAGPSN